MPKKNAADSVREFLAGLDEKEVDDIRSYLEGLVADLEEGHRVDIGKRPHMAMPERRLGDRYSVSMIGSAVNALARGKEAKDRKPVRLMDMSRSGCGMISSALFLPGQILAISFKGPSAQTRKLYAEVVRARECSLPRQTIYQMGCRLVTREVVKHAREELSRRQGVDELFSDPAEIRVVQLAKGKGARSVSAKLEALGYAVTRVTVATRILAALEETDAQIFVVPADAVKGRKPAWLTRLRKERGQTAVVALASNTRESLRLIELGVEQVVDVAEYESQLEHAVKCALFIKLPWLERHVSKYPVKILLAGPSERQLRRSEAILLQENCLVAKARRCAKMVSELDMQQFQVVVVSDLFLGESEGVVADMRQAHPALVIIVESDSAKATERALEDGADLVVAPTANRSQLTQLVDHAYYLALTRSFLL